MHRCSTTVTRSADATVLRVHCDGCDGKRAEEAVATHQLWLVTEGMFDIRASSGRSLLDPMTALVLAKDDPYVVRHPDGPDVCLTVTGAVVDELARDGTRSIQLDAATYATVIAAAHDNLAVTEAIAALEPAPPEATDDDLVEHLKEQLRRSYAADATIGELVAAIGGSVYHACHAFRRTTGTTMHGYRREIRLRHALARLIDGGEPIAHVASATGFASQAHLTNSFRVRFGTSPGKVRAARSL
jgi:AraC-like DNA-binding protein